MLYKDFPFPQFYKYYTIIFVKSQIFTNSKKKKMDPEAPFLSLRNL